MFKNSNFSKIISCTSINQVKYLKSTNNLLILSNENIILYNLDTLNETVLLNEKGTFITIENKFYITGNKFIYFISYDKNKIINKFKASEHSISSLLYYNNKIILSSKKLIKIFEKINNDYVLITIMKYHKLHISGLIKLNKYFISFSSNENLINIYNINLLTINKHYEHEAGLHENSYIIIKNRLIIGGIYYLLLIDVNTIELIKKISFHEFYIINCFCVLNNELFCGDICGLIYKFKIVNDNEYEYVEKKKICKKEGIINIIKSKKYIILATSGNKLDFYNIIK
jgi:hypothetical protein